MNNKGQALIEFAITIPLLTIIIAGAFQFGEIFLTKQKLQQAAKYGVWLEKEHEANTKDKIIEFLTQEKPKLNKNKINVNITDKDISSYYPSKSKVVEIEYEFLPIRLLKKFVPIIKLKGRCVVTVDAWHYGLPE